MISPGGVSLLLQAWGRGDVQAGEDLMPIVYRELRRRARAYLRGERRDHTLQPTALVHEAYVRLVGKERIAWQNRAHFFGVASQIVGCGLFNLFSSSTVCGGGCVILNGGRTPIVKHCHGRSSAGSSTRKR